METIKNVMQLFVAANIAASGSEGSVASTSTVASGEVVVTDLKNVILDATSLPAGLTAFKLVANAGGKLLHSDVVTKGTVRNYNLGKQSAEVQQVDYVGFNGVSGELDTTANNLFTIRMYVRGSSIADFMQQKIKEGFYKSPSTTTQAAVALGLVKSLIKNWSREPEKEILFERVNSGASTSLPDAIGSLNVVKGSKYFTVTDIDNATTDAALVVGDLLRIGTALTGPVYTVVSINTTSNTGEFDVEYQGATATLTQDTQYGIVRVAGIDDYGIKLTGQDRSFVLGKFDSSVVVWKTTIDFGEDATALVTESIKPFPGVGTYQKMAKLEKELQADEYIYRSFLEGAPVDRAQITGALYDFVLVEYDGVIQGGLGSDVKSPKQIAVALEANTALGDDAQTGVVTVLNAIFLAWGSPVSAQTPTA
jgi:hypothetical protein